MRTRNSIRVMSELSATLPPYIPYADEILEENSLSHLLQFSALQASSSLSEERESYLCDIDLFSVEEAYYYTYINPTDKISVSSKYGKRGKKFHYGVDFRAPSGTEILALKLGKVTYASRKSTFGLLVEIEHFDGTVTRYAHMSKILANKGDIVSAGTVIGLVGRTGRATGNHLHLEYLVDGKNVDPLIVVHSSEMVLRHAQSSTLANKK